MSGISIDRNLTPGEKVTFRIDMSFFGYGKVMEFNFDTPKAAPLLNRLNTITLKSERGKDKEKTKGNYSFSKYAKGSKIGSSHYRLKLLLNSKKEANQLDPDELVNLTSSSAGPLAALNNKNFTIIKDNNNDPRYVYLKVSNNFQPTSPVGTAAGSLQEITGVIKTRKYTVSLPKNVKKGLVSEKLPGPAKDGMMEDIPVFAFKRFKGNNVSSVKRKLMNNGNEISEKIPPDRNDVLVFRGKESYSKEFDINNEENFIFYVAIARYVYNKKKDVWEKEWLQTNSSDEVIWGKAIEKGAK